MKVRVEGPQPAPARKLEGAVGQPRKSVVEIVEEWYRSPTGIWWIGRLQTPVRRPGAADVVVEVHIVEPILESRPQSSPRRSLQLGDQVWVHFSSTGGSTWSVDRKLVGSRFRENFEV